MVPKESLEPECFSCGAGIGPSHECRSPSWAGDKPLCGWCYGKLKIDGFLQITDLQRVLPDGSVIKFKRVLPQ